MSKSLFTLVLVGASLGCTDAGLYDARRPPIEANRIAVTGTVCTEDPELAKFPVRLVIVADQMGNLPFHRARTGMPTLYLAVTSGCGVRNSQRSADRW